MRSDTPRVSVLMTTYNGARTIRDSVASMLAQDMRDFELIIVDDASSDITPAILRTVTDPRLIIIRNEGRLGIANSRNRGLLHCRAPYIAALDHDDLSDSRRLGLQAAYLDEHPDVVVVGTGVNELRNGAITPEDQPARTSPALLRFLLHVDNPLAWSSVMLRADVVRGLAPSPLRPSFEPADDFDLYHRLLACGQIARIDAPLTTYRWHAANTSYAAGIRIADNAARVLERSYSPLLGADAAAAAALVVRHGNQRVVVADMGTMARLREIVYRVAESLAAVYPGDRGQIVAGARRVLWRFTRASVRAGHPSFFQLPAPPIDGAISLAVGASRAALRPLRSCGRSARSRL